MSEKTSYKSLELQVVALRQALQHERAKKVIPTQQPISLNSATEAASDDLEFLAKTSSEFYELLPDQDVYSVIGNRLKEIVGDAIVIVNSYDKHTNLFQTKSLIGLGKYTESIINLLNRNPVGMTTEMNDSEAKAILQTGKLSKGPEGIYELSFKSIPKGVCRTIEALLSVGVIYAIGFAYRKKLFGNAIIITRKGENEKQVNNKARLIETFINQASIALQREIFEEALLQSKEKYRSLFENATDAIFITQDGVIKFPNPKAIEIIEYTEEELAKIPFADLLHPEDREMVVERYNKRLRGDKTIPSNYTHRVITKGGKERIVNVNAVNVKWEGRPAGLNFVRDITQQKKLESQLQHAQKMESIATLAGGIAHRFNNALTPIIAGLDLLEMDLDEIGNGTEYLETMKDSAHRMSKLTNLLLAYARGGKYQSEKVPINEFVKDTLHLIKHTIKPSIAIEEKLPSGIFLVQADTTQLQLMLSAIMSNASEAIQDQGKIRIKCDHLMISKDDQKVYPGLNSGPHVSLTIEDDGKGMGEETRRRIFEPFFTTKVQGRGLGMAAAYGIVKNHNGWISVESEPGKGTSVWILLPAVETDETETEQLEIRPVTGTGTILAIEDEEMVMQLNRAILERLGYCVLEAKTGKEAIEIAETFDGDINLALLDILLPDMVGNAIYPLLIRARPKMKVIICSGYSINGPAKEILDAGAEDFIQKPFTMTALSEKLKKVLMV